MLHRRGHVLLIFETSCSQNSSHEHEEEHDQNDDEKSDCTDLRAKSFKNKLKNRLVMAGKTVKNFDGCSGRGEVSSVRR